MILTATMTVAFVLQMTPRDLERARMRKHRTNETRAGTKRTDLDPEVGDVFHLMFPTVASRIRATDILMNDYKAAKVGWPHRYKGKVYDDLDEKGRKILYEQQEAYVATRGFPELYPPRNQVWIVNGRLSNRPPKQKKPAVKANEPIPVLSIDPAKDLTPYLAEDPAKKKKVEPTTRNKK